MRNIYYQYITVAITYFERFTTFKWENRLSFFLPPVIIQLRITNNDSPVVLIEAWVKVEGDIIPCLEI